MARGIDRTSYIICRVQSKMTMQRSSFKDEFQDKDKNETQHRALLSYVSYWIFAIDS